MKSPYLNQAQTYTEFSGLNALKVEARHDKNAAMEKVAKQFESLFVSMMVKSMRDANKVFSEGNFLNSSQSEMYQSMFDSQLSLSMSSGKGIGLAEQMMRQMAGKYGLDKEGQEKPGYHSISDYPRTLPAFVKPEKMARLPETLSEVDAQLEQLKPAATGTEPVPVTVTPASSVEATRASVPSETSMDSLAIIDAAPAEEQTAPAHFDSPQSFVAYLYPIAKQVEAESGIDARVMLAQSALETGWGKHMITQEGQPSYNLFGIKSDSRWQGQQTEVLTTEYYQGVAVKERANFRAYHSYADSFRDYANFIGEHPRYQDAMQALDDPARFTQMLQEAGYATDPAYSQKIQRILNGDLFREVVGQADQAIHGQPVTQDTLLATDASVGLQVR
ncbi:MAG: flagellar assembly peptidoglycan hydrolase FlgJ [Hahellaceae bacterium]|nr:flagellar assembly peptidoglycan hydrolase FlgJ [Hahellaceae bacterium]